MFEGKIKFLLLDVDGVMTDGTIYLSGDGEMLKPFNVKDGLAVELLHFYGIKVGVISGKTSAALTNRCSQLGLDVVITGCKNKLPEIDKICSHFDVSPEEIAFCGDDVIDLPVFEAVGFSVAPKDAHCLVLESSDWVTNAKGGKGVVREIADHLLVKQEGVSLKEVYKPLLAKIVANQVQSLQQ